MVAADFVAMASEWRYAQSQPNADAVQHDAAMAAVSEEMASVKKAMSDLEEALKQNALSGGDNCARAMIIGGILGAMKGTVVPQFLIEEISANIREEVLKKSLVLCHR